MSNHQKNQGLLEKMDEIKNILFSVDKNIYDRLDIINKNIDNLFLLLQKNTSTTTIVQTGSNN